MVYGSFKFSLQFLQLLILSVKNFGNHFINEITLQEVSMDKLLYTMRSDAFLVFFDF